MLTLMQSNPPVASLKNGKHMTNNMALIICMSHKLTKKIVWLSKAILSKLGTEMIKFWDVHTLIFLCTCSESFADKNMVDW